MMAQFTPGSPNLTTSLPFARPEELRVFIYPNPAEDFVNLDITGLSPGSSDVFDFAIYDLTGRVVRNEKIRAEGTSYSGLVNLSDIPAGFYILKVSNDSEAVSTSLVRK
jgi:hypothetical protein